MEFVHLHLHELCVCQTDDSVPFKDLEDKQLDLSPTFFPLLFFDSPGPSGLGKSLTS